MAGDLAAQGLDDLECSLELGSRFGEIAALSLQDRKVIQGHGLSERIHCRAME